MGGADVPRVVAYRQTTVRFECVRCGLRFSIDRAQLVDRLASIPGEIRAIRSASKP